MAVIYEYSKLEHLNLVCLWFIRVAQLCLFYQEEEVSVVKQGLVRKLCQVFTKRGDYS